MPSYPQRVQADQVLVRPWDGFAAVCVVVVSGHC